MDREETTDRWTEVASCTWLHEATFIRSVLDAAGIDAVIPNEHTLAVQPLYGQLLGGVRVLVRADDLTRAREVLDAVPAAPPAEGHDHEPT